MKINYGDYKWKLVGISKKTSEEIIIFPQIIGFIVEKIMYELAKYDSECRNIIIEGSEYNRIIEELKNKLLDVTESKLISVECISKLTNISIKRLYDLLGQAGMFDTGELFVLSSILDKLLEDK